MGWLQRNRKRAFTSHSKLVLDEVWRWAQWWVDWVSVEATEAWLEESNFCFRLSELKVLTELSGWVKSDVVPLSISRARGGRRDLEAKLGNSQSSSLGTSWWGAPWRTQLDSPLPGRELWREMGQTREGAECGDPKNTTSHSHLRTTEIHKARNINNSCLRTVRDALFLFLYQTSNHQPPKEPWPSWSPSHPTLDFL